MAIPFVKIENPFNESPMKINGQSDRNVSANKYYFIKR